MTKYCSIPCTVQFHGPLCLLGLQRSGAPSRVCMDCRLRAHSLPGAAPTFQADVAMRSVSSVSKGHSQLLSTSGLRAKHTTFTVLRLKVIAPTFVKLSHLCRMLTSQPNKPSFLTPTPIPHLDSASKWRKAPLT